MDRRAEHTVKLGYFKNSFFYAASTGVNIKQSFLRPIVLKFDWILISTRPFLKIFLILLCMVLRGMPNSFEISLFSKPGINREIIL